MAEIQKLVAQVVGVILTLVGLVGFFTGNTLLGFGINTLHNLVHLLTGLLGVWAGFFAGMDMQVAYNKWLGVIYILVFILGLVVPGYMESLLNVNMADNILHLVLGVVLAGVGFGVKS